MIEPPLDPDDLTPTREASGSSDPVDEPVKPLEEVGGCRLVRIIGSGGMGTVYEAQQENPARTVAVKMMKAGMTSRTALARFEFESRVLARLRHPNIAQVYGAGTHDDGSGGVPYFIMEYLPNAVTLTGYAGLHRLGLRERLELFLPICDAVQHGHVKGVLHRDLKPGNVLVDEEGTPKVIDYGVARTTDSDLMSTTLQTNVGQIIGTIQYMSPEQSIAKPDEIDTRTDVYAMGVMLYQLLAGQLPYDLRGLSIVDAIRVISEAEPARLSSIDRSLRGDVETIIHKALEKDPERRYQSAASVAADVRAWLVGEPIAARPPSMGYLASRFARRNRALVGGVLGIIVALVAGLVISLVFLDRAVTAEQNAEAEARMASASRDFLLGTLAQADPRDGGAGPGTPIGEIFAAGAGDIDENFQEFPEVRQALHETMALAQGGIGQHEIAVNHLTSATQVARDRGDEETASRLEGLLLDQLLYLHRDREAAELLERRPEVLSDPAATAARMMQAGFLNHDRGQLALAERFYRSAADCLSEDAGPDRVFALDLLARVLIDENRLDEAAAAVEAADAARVQVEVPATSPPFGVLNRGYLAHARGQWGEAAVHYRSAREAYAQLGAAAMADIAMMDLDGIIEDAHATGHPLEADSQASVLTGIPAGQQVISLRNRGRVLARLQHRELGLDRLVNAVELARANGLNAALAHSLLARADVLEALGQAGQASRDQAEAASLLD